MSDPVQVVYKLRDKNPKMVKAWTEMFADYSNRVEVSQAGDIFKGGPAADAIVSPANSFGFMDGGIDKVYSLHFGWQLHERLQKVIQTQQDGELLVGQAVIIPTFEGGAKVESMKWKGFNGDQPIKFLISAPTMRVPLEVPESVNAYLAFRATILAVQKHNATAGNEPIRNVLCPGLATNVGRMPHRRCAVQMLQAFEIWDIGKRPEIKTPSSLEVEWKHHDDMNKFDKTK